MDGQRPMEELSETPNLSTVLEFRNPDEGNQIFFVEEITGPTTTSIVVRVIDEEDEYGPNYRTVETQEEWEELLAEVLSPPNNESKDSNKKTKRSDDARGNGDIKSSKNAASRDTGGDENMAKSRARSLYIFARPEPGKQRSLNLKLPQACAGTSEMLESSPRRRTGIARVADMATSTIVGLIDGCRSLMGSFLQRPDQASFDEKSNKGPPADDPRITTPATPEHTIERRKLRNIPFTLKTFRFVVKRLSIHSWIKRVISRADVQVFEQTVTQMPLYLSTGETKGKEQAIIYNWRSSNVWENDMASTVTHFPRQKLTLGIVFGSSTEQEESILTRLREASEDVAHPILLAGVLTEMERARQMDAIEETIEDLETQIFLLDSETVTTRTNMGFTKAERNRQKTKAWLNATFARNSLLGYQSLLFKMRKYIDEFPHLANQLIAHKDSIHRRQIGRREPKSGNLNAFDSRILSKCWSEGGTLTEEPEMILYDEHQESIQQAGMRMGDRLITIIEEYDDKIRDFTMRIDNMAMATQWSQGETNMEIATSSAKDSSQMRSIALVTMVFLPGTFFASIFSMSFFNWTPGSSNGNNAPVISEKIWIYFFITGVFTCLTLALFWYFVLHRQKTRRHPRDDDCPV